MSGWQDSNLRPPAPKAGAITGLRYTPKCKSDPTRTRTWNLRFRKPLLYPVELWNHIYNSKRTNPTGGGTGIRTRGTLERYGSLANYWFKPLTHPTKRSAKIHFYYTPKIILINNFSYSLLAKLFQVFEYYI